jgi:hypothetical protein
LQYIEYDYWVELSGGSRLPRDAAPRIRAGVGVFDVPSEGFLAAADSLGDVLGHQLVLATAEPGKRIVVVEGHVRRTVFALRPEAVPDGLPALLGSSTQMDQWALY